MAIEKKTIRLLILEDSQNEAERLVSLFRNAGHATRVHRLTSPEDLAETLQQSWDLLIAAPTSECLEPGEALATLRRQSRDIPFIQLVADNSSDAITDALMLGAQDALPQGEDERLVLVANRELAGLAERRARRAAELALREYEDAEELEGLPVIDLIASCDQGAFKDFLKGYQNDQRQTELVCTGVKLDGQEFKARISLSAATYDGEPCIQVVIRGEVDNAELEEKLREVSSQDPVTGLYNRSHFLDLMDAAVQQAVTARKPSTLAYIHLNGYPSLQADHGLSGIDLLLGQLAGLMREQFGEEADLARFGDSIFAALFKGKTPEQAQAALQRLLKKVENHLFELNGRSAQATLSIGVAGLDEKTAKAQDVMNRAHRCADDAARKGGSQIKQYNPAEELAAAAQRGDVIAILQQALETNSFRLLFQPVISLRGDSHENYEVLLRLLNPQGQEVPPAEFLHAAKEAGLAEKIDRWVILNSIKLLAEHRAKGHQTKLFVHLSSASLQDPGLLPWLGVALKAARLPPESLVFQISEADATSYLKQAKQLTQGLATLHCQAAISQFGCSLNPFNALKHLTVQFIKIDGSFVQDLNQVENQEILKGLIAELHEQQKLSIVPFVESASVLATLWQAGATYIQGYYLQGPSQAMDYDFSSGDE